MYYTYACREKERREGRWVKEKGRKRGQRGSHTCIEREKERQRGTESEVFMFWSHLNKIIYRFI